MGTIGEFLNIFSTNDKFGSRSWITSTGLICEIKVRKTEKEEASGSVNYPMNIFNVYTSRKVTPIWF